jgi:hypothetical protein
VRKRARKTGADCVVVVKVRGQQQRREAFVCTFRTGQHVDVGVAAAHHGVNTERHAKCGVFFFRRVRFLHKAMQRAQACAVVDCVHCNFGRVVVVGGGGGV